LLAFGLGFGQMALDSFARGAGVALLQLGVTVLLLVAGLAGLLSPLMGVDAHQEGQS
jgi:hypothetical protein